MSHPEASGGGPARPGNTAPAGGPACLPAGRPIRIAGSRTPTCGARGREPVGPGGPWRKRTRAGGFGRVRGRPGPCHPRLRGLLVDPCGGKRGKGARGPETRVAARRGPHGPPWDRGPAGRRPRPARSASSGPHPSLPGHRPSPEGAAPPAVNGEEAGTEEAGRRACDARPPPPHSSPPVVRREAEEGGGWTGGRTASAPPGPPRARARGQTLVSRADFQ